MYRVAAVLMVLSMSACMDEGLGGPGMGSGDAQLAVLNALGAGDQVKFTVDGGTITLPAPGSSISLALASGTHRLEVRGLVYGDLLASADFAVPGGSRRSAVVSGATGKGIALLVASDTASLPPAGAAKVRMVHAVPKAPIYDSYLAIAGQPADSGARFVSPFTFGSGQNPQFPGYAVRGPGMYQVTLKPTGTATTALQSDPFQMAAGQVFSVVLSENADGGLVLRVVRER